MIDKKENNGMHEESQEDFERKIEEKIAFYQIEELHRELDYLKHRLALVPESVQWCCKHLRQFWWTISSLLGLGWLHDGSRPLSQNISSTPSINLPTIQPGDMPAPRLFLDVSITYKSKLNTGVQRVIRELCRYGQIGGELAPVIINRGMFVTVPDMNVLEYREGDKILLLDSGWTHTKMYVPALERAKSDGFDVILGIYDLIPTQYPGFVHPYFTQLFEEWLRTISPYCSAILAISRYSADSYLTWARKNLDCRKITSVGWFYLGADLSEHLKEGPEKEDLEVEEREQIPSDFWLSVGTIEPRKGYTVALDAFDRVWRDNSSLSYVIIGRQGDLSSNITERILQHPQFGKKLFWPKNVDDGLLKEYYREAIGVLIPALAEGFGLPLIEAHFHGKPIVASDLPVFREIAPSGVSFFKIADDHDLAMKIINNSAEHSNPSSRGFQSWRTATEKMIGLVKNNAYQISNG